MTQKTIILDGEKVEVSNFTMTEFGVSINDSPASCHVAFSIKGGSRELIDSLKKSSSYEIVYEGTSYKVSLLNIPHSSSICFEGRIQ
jgi:predicted SpoU family rRNA methylase